MTDAPAWYAKLFQCTTGLVVGDLPLVKTPGALQQINAQGTWNVTTQLSLRPGIAGAIQRDMLRTNARGYRFGVAVCYGTRSASDYILQAGPIIDHDLIDEASAQYTLSGADAWALWAVTLLIDPATKVNATYGPTSMQGIAVAILNAGLARNPLPIDVPAAIAGAVSRTYNWWDLAFVEELLQALTQANGGPDAYFRPHFSDSSHIRWEAVLGNPYITQSGAPLFFDHGSNLIEVRNNNSSGKLAGKVYAKGNGSEAGTIVVSATDATLQGNGWPLMESVDSSQTNLTDLTALGAVASGNLALNNRPVETWTSWARTGGRVPLGTYGPGLFANYNIPANHPSIPPSPTGYYNQRILGFQRQEGDDAHVIQHVLHATQGAI